MTSRRLVLLLLALLQLTSTTSIPAQQPDSTLFREMKWRAIGPYRGGRTKAAAGVPGRPHMFYIGVCNGGVWKTTDAGRTWQPIFDDQSTGSIGWVAVAPSDPNILYVGSGEGLPRPDLSTGNGMYKSVDAGKTWTHLGLGEGQQIPKIAVDPRNPERLLVAVLGHPYGPNEQRGIYRSTDGGRSFQKVFYKDENTGGKDVDIDPSNPDVVYATLWEQRQGPWENAVWGGATGGIFKSTDGGTTWKPIMKGLPDGFSQAELAVAPSNPQRLYATVGASGGAGVFRSDDAGETWARATTDNRIPGRIDEATPIVFPKDPDSLIVTNVVSYKSTDGGKTWTPFKGAPGGDDYQSAWINPDDPNIILLTSDQGAVVTLNGGQSWSSWYNQPTAQLYHVMADNAFPYRVCGGQQESGSACVASRGNDGQITLREWHPVGVEEYGYAAPDPLNPDIVFGGKITRYDRRTGQVSSVSPVGGQRGAPAAGAQTYRTVRTQPVVFSLVDPRVLFFANNYLWKTVDGGINWKQVSPDLTRKTYELPKSIGKYSAQPTAQAIQRGVIYTIGPSYKDVNRIWIGTDDGLIHTTADGGGTWKNVTPPQMTPWMKVFTIDPGRFDGLTAYAAVNTLRLDDMRPHIYRTHDGGATWQEIVNGIGEVVSVVREDPQRKGLLFAGSETQVYYSFDDGDHWQPLRLNMAPSSVRDLIIKDDDLVVGTHGRGIWILDDITPLRQIEPQTLNNDAVLFKPQTALRVRWNMNTDTPMPPDEPNAANPPEGAIVHYYLKSAASGPLTLEILQQDGKVVRRYSSTDPVTPLPEPRTNAPLPLYWYRQPQSLSTAAGLHRFTWDVHYQPLNAAGPAGGLPIAAVPYNTVPPPATPWVSPGTYTVKLTVNGKTYTQPVTVKADPRVKTPPLTMNEVYAQTRAMYFGAVAIQLAQRQACELRDQAATRESQAEGAGRQALTDFNAKLTSVAGSCPPGAGQGQRGQGTSLAAAFSSLQGLMNSLQAADVQPTAVQLAAITAARAEQTKALAAWNSLKTVDLPALNLKLRAASLAELSLVPR
jgi:photosystem II stability/assembly factor-like uncharacterized protein